MNKPATWIELRFDRVGSEIRISARGSRAEEPDPQLLRVDPEKLLQFASAVQHAARHGQPLAPRVLDEARALQQAVLDGAIGTLFAKLAEAANGPLLVRLRVPDRDLQGLPWEALCNASEALGFWGTSPVILPVRGVATHDAWLPREVRGVVKVLAIAPTGTSGLDNLKQALTERIKTGEVEWLDPIVGEDAKIERLPQQLRARSTPHVLHFLGHGAVVGGLPVLRLADEDDEAKWVAVEIFASHLRMSFSGTLRLVVLEACEGAKPAAFASAAETLAKAGADAVVAHLWPVRAHVARTCSTELYRVLTSAHSHGDVAVAMNAARLSMLGTYDTSAEAMSPVLYLRGPEGKIFDFAQRQIVPPHASASMPDGALEISPALARVVRSPYSLVLGDRSKDHRDVLDAFRNRLQSELKSVAPLLPEGLPIGTLAQWFAMHRGGDELEQEFQDTFRIDMEGPPMIAAIARVLCPGVHTTLLRNPWLELSVAEQQPERTIYVVQPRDDTPLVMKREAGGKKWERMRAVPEAFHPEEDILMLRPCRGYTSNKTLVRPLLTEDDYLTKLGDFWNGSAMPRHLAELLGGTLRRHPALIVGLSMLTANHRMLLRTLYERGLPPGSLAVVEQDDGERKLWEKGAGLPGKNEGVEVVEASSPMLCATFAAIPKAGRR